MFLTPFASFVTYWYWTAATPPLHYKVLVMPSDGLMEEGSDSDGKCGPFIKSGVKKEEFHNMDEDTPKALVVAVAAPDIKGRDVAPGVPDTELMIDAVVIQVMKVIELWVELKKHRVKVVGNKPELQACLIKAIVNGLVVLTDSRTKQVNN